jgi:hypothetical protein
MRFFKPLLLLFTLTISITAQSRQQAIEKFNDLKNQALIQEKRILAPDKEDVEKARQENVGVFRILPREIYDKGLFTTRGGGAYYSFYFRIPDWGYGSDVGLEQNNFSVPNYGVLADLGEVSLNEITKESPSANSIINYQKVKDTNSVYEDFQTLRYQGLKTNETIFRGSLPAIVGHTYLVRSISTDYYDILVAFKVQRKDSDGSLVIFWKLIEQFVTPHRSNSEKTQLPDVEILKNTKGWLRSDIFSNVQAEVNNGVISLRGTISKENLAYAVQLANSSGATKVLNFLTVK